MERSRRIVVIALCSLLAWTWQLPQIAKTPIGARNKEVQSSAQPGEVSVEETGTSGDDNDNDNDALKVAEDHRPTYTPSCWHPSLGRICADAPTITMSAKDGSGDSSTSTTTTIPVSASPLQPQQHSKSPIVSIPEVLFGSGSGDSSNSAPIALNDR
jgi:hypothetical protein